MKLIQMLFVSLTLLASSQAFALSADHPANPAAAEAFTPADYFTGKPVQLAANEHQHEGGASTAEESDGKGCKRGEGKGGCCCCKCCDKGEGKEGDGCIRKSGSEHEHSDGKKGCGMMKKGMGESDAGKAGGSDAHEGHH